MTRIASSQAQLAATPVAPPLVTVVLPTHRRPQLLKRAIESALVQTYPHIRVCVYDNASDDSTEAVARDLMSKDSRVGYYCHERDVGMAENFRFGLERVETPFFCILCDDDQLLPGFLAAGLNAFDAYPEARFVATTVLRIYPDGTTLEPHGQWRTGVYSPPEGLFRLLRNGVLLQTGILFRREVLTEVGTYDPGAGGAGDLDFQLRIAARLPFAFDPTPGGIYFSHDASISGARRVDFVWPSCLTIIHNLEVDIRIPSDVRARATKMLVSLIKAKVFALGLGSAFRGDREESARASGVLRWDLRAPWRSLLVAGVSFICSRLPVARRLALWAVIRTRAFRSTGLRRTQHIQATQSGGHE